VTRRRYFPSPSFSGTGDERYSFLMRLTRIPRLLSKLEIAPPRRDPRRGAIRYKKLAPHSLDMRHRTRRKTDSRIAGDSANWEGCAETSEGLGNTSGEYCQLRDANKRASAIRTRENLRLAIRLSCCLRRLGCWRGKFARRAELLEKE